MVKCGRSQNACSDGGAGVNIQRAAEASGLTASTIRFYEKRGVLPRPPRGVGGYREYTAEHVDILRLARGLRDLGLPLTEVGAILAVAHDGDCGDLRETLTRTLTVALVEVEGRIVELGHTRVELGSLLDGLGEMRADERRVPGMSPCGCVELVAGDGRQR